MKLVASLSILSCLTVGQGGAAGALPPLVIVIDGQSNAGSQGRGEDLGAYPLAVGAGVLLYAPEMTCEKDGFTGAPHGSCKGRWRGRFGVELGIHEELSRAYPGRQIVYVRNTQGGTRIREWCDAALCVGEKSQYRKTWGYVRRAIELAGGEAEIGGVVWVHNEAQTESAAAAAENEPMLRELIANWRRDSGNAELPFVFYEVHTRLESEHAAVVEAGLERIAADTGGVAMVANRDLTTWPGEPHFDSAGMWELGRRQGAALVQLRGDG